MRAAAKGELDPHSISCNQAVEQVKVTSKPSAVPAAQFQGGDDCGGLLVEGKIVITEHSTETNFFAPLGWTQRRYGMPSGRPGGVKRPAVGTPFASRLGSLLVMNIMYAAFPLSGGLGQFLGRE